MKRFLVFNIEPCDEYSIIKYGWETFECSFNLLEEAKNYCVNQNKSNLQIVDLESETVVEKTRRGEYLSVIQARNQATREKKEEFERLNRERVTKEFIEKFKREPTEYELDIFLRLYSEIPS